jgi:hypothetical protein
LFRAVHPGCANKSADCIQHTKGCVANYRPARWMRVIEDPEFDWPCIAAVGLSGSNRRPCGRPYNDRSSEFAEGHIVSGKTIVGERHVIVAVAVPISLAIRLQGDFMESIIVNVDGAFIEVSGLEVMVAIHRGTRETGVAGAVRGLNHNDGVRGGRRGAGSDSDG